MLTNRKSLWWWLTLGCCLVSFLAASQSAPAQQRQAAAEIIAAVGKVEIKSPGETQWRPAKCEDLVYPQDQIRTQKDSRAKLFFKDESILVLSEDTTLDIAKFQMTSQGQRESAFIKLVHGAVRFVVQKVASGVTPNFEIQGKTAIMGIRGTEGIYESRSPDRVIFLGGAGAIIFRNLTTGQSLTITANNWAVAAAGQVIQTGVVTPAMREQLAPYFRPAQVFVPDSICNPGPPPPGLVAILQGMGITFLGEPQFSNSTPNNTFSPGAQGNPGGGGPGLTLPVIHQPLLPK
jgi:hypothetical protein